MADDRHPAERSLDADPYLAPHIDHLKYRYDKFRGALDTIDKHGGGLDAFSQGYNHFGFSRREVDGKAGIHYKEWAPGAKAASLVGDFNAWNPDSAPMIRDDFGIFTLFLPDAADGTPAIPHDSFIKVSLVLESGERVDRVPAWVRYAVLDEAASAYCGKYWCPPEAAKHTWLHPRPELAPMICTADRAATPLDAPSRDGPDGGGAGSGGAGAGAGGGGAARVVDDPLRIYEAHVGMATQEERVGTYREFADKVLPRVKALGYNCVQLMAIMEHAYYGSFGYHVTNFFAASSRFGTPEDLKYLVDAAHAAGLLIIMDVVHSHASKNVADGLNQFDGTEFQYFHAGGKGNHDLWDSRLFDYGKLEVQRFLLSNLRYYVEEFRFDGYRFDGVTSMLYVHHGMGTGFSGDYHEYFGEATDVDAVVYLMLANHLLHSLRKPVVTVAEDVSGMPTLCRPVWEGGVGFDYRLGMAIPDKWIEVLKEVKDEDWDMGNIVHTLMNRRYQERTVAYVESHDQALVGDKTVAFRLMDKDMYDHMTTLRLPNAVIDRGIALHKMIRLITLGLGGEAYLNFMGNEFGHPEWIDFPREGNGWSYKHCRRQWNLVDDPLLRYKHLNAWDAAMHALQVRYGWLATRESYVSLKHEDDKVVVFERVGLVFAFNFHTTKSFPEYRIGAPAVGTYRAVLDSDWEAFGGHSRNDGATEYHATDFTWHDRPASMLVYLPCRAAIVYAKQ